MRTRLAKLGSALILLAAGLILGLTPQPAQAIAGCPAYVCCDSHCYGIRLCYFVGGSCLCEQYCRFNPGSGGSD